MRGTQDHDAEDGGGDRHAPGGGNARTLAARRGALARGAAGVADGAILAPAEQRRLAHHRTARRTELRLDLARRAFGEGRPMRVRHLVAGKMTRPQIGEIRRVQGAVEHRARAVEARRLHIRGVVQVGGVVEVGRVVPMECAIELRFRHAIRRAHHFLARQFLICQVAQAQFRLGGEKLLGPALEILLPRLQRCEAALQADHRRRVIAGREAHRHRLYRLGGDVGGGHAKAFQLQRQPV
ncbi:MAG: hypothetical protein B7X67_17495 [Rhizobiales bacterium 39-66-18]|nr:MAG: hypothetical protein B7X67_17495 [Rhizobiales bacterium 39-66-18]